MKSKNRLADRIGTVLILFFLINSGFTGCSQYVKKPSLGKIESVRMNLTLEPAGHQLDAETTVRWIKSGVDTLFFLLNRNLAVSEVKVDGTPFNSAKTLAEGGEIKAQLDRIIDTEETSVELEHFALYGLPVAGEKKEYNVTFTYSGEIFDDVEVASFSRWEIADETTGLISEKGAFLIPSSGYYPQLPGKTDPMKFRTTIKTPEGWESLAEGAIIQRQDQVTTFDSEHPVDGSYIVAGPYKISSIQEGDVEIAMYYFEGSEDLTERYLNASAEYIKKYSDLIGTYAYSRFSVVENWFPTGYGMPSYTLLGSRVLRLPFIIYTSLGHEICHNWWGNGVFVDYGSGNWCEGFTVYCADYLYKVEEGPEAAMQYRLDVNRDYTDYIVHGDEEDFPLTDFRGRTTPGTRTVGYGKAMMVVHMIHERIGDDAFWSALKEVYREHKFTKAGWDDFLEAFSKTSGEDLSWIMQQWISRPGAPSLVLENVNIAREGDNRILEFDLHQQQEGETYRLDVPIQLTFSDGNIYRHVLRDMEGVLYHAKIRVNGAPVTLEVDPEMHLFRVLDPREAPPTLAGFFAEEAPVIVIPDTPKQMLSAYRDFAKAMNRKGTATVITAGELSQVASEARATLFLGRIEKLGGKEKGPWELNGEPLEGEEVAAAYAWRDHDNPELVHLAVWGESPGALAPLTRKLPHYGKYSYLGFSSGNNIVKGRWAVQDSPLRFRFAD